MSVTPAFWHHCQAGDHDIDLGQQADPLPSPGGEAMD
jgi:hypothetical protein